MGFDGNSDNCGGINHALPACHGAGTSSAVPLKIRVPGGAMILLPAGQPHALKAVTRFKMLLTMIRS